MKKIFFLFVLVAISEISVAQNSFKKEFVSPLSNVNKLIKSSDGGYFAMGDAATDIATRGDDAYIVKLDSNYNPVWSEAIGTSVFESSYDIVETKSRNILSLGLKFFGKDFFLLYKLDEDGDLIWTKKYTYDLDDPFSANIIELNENSFIIYGTNSYGVNSVEPSLLLEVDSSGNVKWSKKIQGNIQSCIKNNDSSFVIVEQSEQNNPYHNTDIVKIDSNGDIQWCKHVNNFDGTYSGYDIIKVADGFFMAGKIHTDTTKQDDILLAKFTIDGDFIWAKSYASGYSDYANKIIETSDGNFLLVGVSFKQNKYVGDITLIKINPHGKILWTSNQQNTFQSDFSGVYPLSVLQSKDSSIILLYRIADVRDYYFLAHTEDNGDLCDGIKLSYKTNDVALSITELIKDYYDVTVSIGTDTDNVIPVKTEFKTLCSSILPLHLLSFTAQHNGSTNLLKWTTAEELNTDRFEIQRSSNGRNFITIGNVKSLSNGKTSNVYAYTDAQPLKQVNYYRLKMFDKDGKYTYSPVRSINNASSFDVSLYPNPVKNLLTLNFNAAKNMDLQIEIVNAEGKKVYSQKLQLTTGTFSQKINVASLHSGTYFIKCIAADGQTGLKFVKQ